MSQKIIKTSIVINTNREKVWKILTNFDDYPSWNPFILSVKGKMSEGEKISVELTNMKFKPRLITYKEGTEIRWMGSLLFKGIFDGEHSLELIENEDGTVTFKHEEIFNGILVGLFTKKLETQTRKGFESMNEKLKVKAEEN